MVTDDCKDAVYGEKYDSAVVQMELVNQAIRQRVNIGFESSAACEAWAKEHLLDMVVSGKAQHQFYHVSHKGEIFLRSAWMDYYSKDVLFVWDNKDSTKPKRLAWSPAGFAYHDDARINGEVGDGLRLPLYHRDYFVPTGFYDSSLGTFNIAKPFPVAAKATGADTAYIFEYISHIAQECAPYLLSWLKMKMMYPTKKTEVTPIIVSREQGNGKTTFAEVICKGLFGKDNVLVTDQYDSQSRFNADYADALVICLEEKEETDKRNPAATIKSRATATTIRKEHKGLDPTYQDSHTEYIMTTNKDVPVKFEDKEQRRFMIMEADESFTRKKSPLASEVFAKLYGVDVDGNYVGAPFVSDHNMIAQFKHELFNMNLPNVKDFPHTSAYAKCHSLPRTTETVEIETILRSLMPFIKETLMTGKAQKQLQRDDGTVATITSYVNDANALQYMPYVPGHEAYVALCRPLVFYDAYTGKQYPHSTVERGIYDCATWILAEYGIRVIHNMDPLPGGFRGVQNRYAYAAAARFALPSTTKIAPIINPITVPSLIDPAGSLPEARVGKRLRVNHKWKADIHGEYETVNEMKVGVDAIYGNKSNNVAYMDTFLFEGDETTAVIYKMEQLRIDKGIRTATSLFKERLHIQLIEASRLFNIGIAARVVYSGGKSYHILVRVKDSPQTLEEYKWLHAHLATSLSDKVIYDPVTSDPARLTRAPITCERVFNYNGVQVTGTQRLIYENWSNVYDYKWRELYQQWLDRPLAPYEQGNNRRLLPTKAEYKDAMWALLNGTFWTDSQWNGRRQQCFFPGYRLCRYLGYDHATLWSNNGILDGLDNYYKSTEIQYWRSREQSALIESIDRDIEAMEVNEHEEDQ